ncbi:MAG: dihydrofolate reductase family protein [Anaerolineales bacterium]
MRKLIASEFITLDGVMEDPGKWQLKNNLFDEAMGPVVGEAYAADALLLGRVTYQEWAEFWPKQSAEDPFTVLLNDIPKFVVSTTLKRLDWANSRLIQGDVAGEVNKLKGESGRHILLPGSATLVNSLHRAGLIDEYQLFVHPILVGRGKRLFKDGIDPTLLTLAGTRTFDNGVVVLTYRPKGRAVVE